MDTTKEQMTPEQHQADPPSEYAEATMERTLDSMPDSKMRYKQPGARGTHYRGGPYAGLTEVDGKLTHSAETTEREDYTPRDPVSKRFGHLEVGNRAQNEGDTEGGDQRGIDNSEGGNDREYSGFTRHSQLSSYAKNNDIATPDKWDQMSVDDKKAWLDENT